MIVVSSFHLVGDDLPSVETIWELCLPLSVSFMELEVQ